MKNYLLLCFFLAPFGNIFCQMQLSIQKDASGLIIYSITGVPLTAAKQKVIYEGVSYNYAEKDYLGNYMILGNLDKKGKPQGNWYLILEAPEEIYWGKGKVKDGYLNGKWFYSHSCIQNYRMGYLTGPVCPNF